MNKKYFKKEKDTLTFRFRDNSSNSRCRNHLAINKDRDHGHDNLAINKESDRNHNYLAITVVIDHDSNHLKHTKRH